MERLKCTGVSDERTVGVQDPERQVAVAWATKFLRWRRVLLSFAWILLHVSNLAPSMSRWLLGLWKICAPDLRLHSSREKMQVVKVR